MYTTISSFTEVTLIPNSLLILDIDDTVLKFDDINHKWWEKWMAHFLEIHNDKDIAEEKALDTWREHVTINLPKHTDEKGICELIKKAQDIDITIIFLTARSDNTKYLTENVHLSHLSLNVGKVYYANKQNKGKIMSEHIKKDFPDKDTYIYIEDAEFNIKDVIGHMANKINNFVIYKFVHKHI